MQDNCYEYLKILLTHFLCLLEEEKFYQYFFVLHRRCNPDYFNRRIIPKKDLLSSKSLRGVSCCGAAQLFTAMISKGILQGGWVKECKHG